MAPNNTPFFSVILPTRNRLDFLCIAVESILKQSFDDYELVIVNDGSEEKYKEEFEKIVELAPNKISILNLRQYQRGHGQSYSINSGAFASTGKYLTFLDDDDFWTDENHLEKVHQAITSSPVPIDLHFSNQVAHDESTGEKSALWLFGLSQQLKKKEEALEGNSFPINKTDLLNYQGFAHLNVTVIRREIFTRINGMDEDIRYECDLDFYLRATDAANNILYSPDIVAQHRVPDKSKSQNMSTAISVFQKMNYRIYLLNKIIVSSTDKDIINNAKRRLTYALKHSASAADKMDNPKLAFLYAKQALATKFSLKWLSYCLYLAIRNIFKPHSDA